MFLRKKMRHHHSENIKLTRLTYMHAFENTYASITEISFPSVTHKRQHAFVTSNMFLLFVTTKASHKSHDVYLYVIRHAVVDQPFPLVQLEFYFRLGGLFNRGQLQNIYTGFQGQPGTRCNRPAELKSTSRR